MLAYVTIDAGYFILKQYADSLSDDEAPPKHIAKKLIPVLKDIIAARKVIDAPTEKDEKMLALLQKIITDKPPRQ